MSPFWDKMTDFRAKRAFRRPRRRAFRLVKLLLLRRSGQRSGRTVTSGNRLGNSIKVPRPNFALMLGRGIAILFGREFRLLQFRISRHAAIAIAMGQTE